MNESDLKLRLVHSQLPYGAELAARARPTIHAVATPFQAEPQVGASRIGGLPDLPKSIPWPKWRRLPQIFIAQINLAELPEIGERYLLPSVGHLFFFYEPTTGIIRDVPDCFGSWSVVYSEETPARMSEDEAGDSSLEGPRPAPLALTFSEIWTVPMGDSVWYSLPVEDWYRVVDFMDGFYREHGINMYYKHQLFGYSDWLGTGNGDEVECEQNRRGLSRFRKPPQTIRREIEEAAKGWLLLLQVSDEGDRGSVRFGDVGAIHYWIRHRDLECHDFSAACATMASH